MGCSHGLVVDEARDAVGEEVDLEWYRQNGVDLRVEVVHARRCLTCGTQYDRSAVLSRLRAWIMSVYRPGTFLGGGEDDDRG